MYWIETPGYHLAPLQKLLDKWHRTAITISISHAPGNSAGENGSRTEIPIISEIKLTPDVLRKRRIKNFLHISCFIVGSGNPADYIGREVNVGIEIKIMIPFEWTQLCIVIVIEIGPDDKLPFDTPGQRQVGIQLRLELRSNIGRIHIINRNQIKLIFVLFGSFPHITVTRLERIQGVLIRTIIKLISQVYPRFGHVVPGSMNFKRRNNFWKV